MQNCCHLFRYLPCYQHLIYLINAHQLALHALHFALMKDCHRTVLNQINLMSYNVGYVKLIRLFSLKTSQDFLNA